MVSLLLPKSNVNQKNKHEETPFMLAMNKGHDEIVKKLLQTGKVDCNDQSEQSDLHRAYLSGNICHKRQFIICQIHSFSRAVYLCH